MAQENSGYSGEYSQKIKQLYEQIAGREGFSYQPSLDPQYAAYKQEYERQGRLAMADSMAQAAHLTGGYGSSYGQSVGNQAYGSYLEKLNNVLPELYSAAYQRYVGEGDELSRQLSAATELDRSQYQRYADERDWDMAQEKFDYQKQADSYDRLFELISGTGYLPSDEELATGGMSREQADALSNEFIRQLEARNSGSSGGYSSRGWGANRFNYKDYDPYASSSSGSGSSSSSGTSGGSTAGGKSEPSASLVIKTHS